MPACQWDTEMKNWMTTALAVIAVSATSSNAASPESGSMAPRYASVTKLESLSVDEEIRLGVRAYRAGDFETATNYLEKAAIAGEVKAQRYLGYVLLEGPQATPGKLRSGVELLKNAAIAGDYASLIRLEDLRRKGLAHSPTMDDMVEIETARAENGDPVAAWRLAGRYENGEGVMPSAELTVRWLEVSAMAETTRFPKAGEAAFRLCETFALNAEQHDPKRARAWCAKAAENGHAGAAIVLRRLASL
ncbi:tetratricopeptide repeat protein [Hyphococcus sp. DH-69]|uniref:tetratricopeptide repeat protein n=1 Tax=Hyphococcus formosus TaxID=3143534 RepID=UPI00398B7665